MESTNHSIAGKETQSLSIFKKIGVFLFIVGILGLIELSRLKIYDVASYQENIKLLVFGSFGLQLLGAFIFTYEHHHFSLSSIFSMHTNKVQKAGLFIGAAGFSIFILAWTEVITSSHTLFLWLSFGLMASGILINTYGLYGGHTKGIKNNYVWFNTLTGRGLLGWVSGIILTLFYIQLYWFSDSMEGLIRMFDPLSYLLTGGKASQWFLYGTVYTFLIFFLGIKFIYKYRHNRYQVIRTISVILFQVVFAYAIPHILEAFNDYQGYFGKDLKQVWPLNYYITESYQLDALSHNGVSGTFYFVWGLILFLVVTPFLTYFYGKRWYCSWVCGCGGLAETAGDSFRQLSSKTRTSWQIERWVVHSVMVFVLLMTVASLWPYFSGADYKLSFITITTPMFFYAMIFVLALSAIGGALLFKKHRHPLLLVGTIILLLIAGALSYGYFGGVKDIFSVESKSIKKVYGFLVGSAFAGVIGVGFYPLLGNRVWCRFGCPMAGYMGIIQRFKSKFRITTNGAQCISCGNCSTYCEQGIDVRAYAQKGENIVRASCVGCGVCSAVCPRGVLKLENGPEEGRFDSNPLIVSKDGVDLNS